MIDLQVQYIRQSFEFDCWYAALRMLVKYRHGANAEPTGHPHAEMKGLQRQSQRTGLREQAARNGVDPRTIGVRNQLRLLPPRGLKLHEFGQLAGYNGLTAPMLPPPYDAQSGNGGFTSSQVESLMRIHGPLWCAFGYGHVVVAKGIDVADNVLVHNPQGQANESYPIANFNRLLNWDTNCVMFLPAVPNASAFA